MNDESAPTVGDPEEDEVIRQRQSEADRGDAIPGKQVMMDLGFDPWTSFVTQCRGIYGTVKRYLGRA